MIETKKTYFAVHLELAQRRGEDYVPIQYSTLNEGLGYSQTEAVPSGEYPTTEYLHLGIGGHSARLANSGGVAVDTAEHDIQDAMLYNAIPFVVRPVEEDLSPTERQRYGARIMMDRDGNNYFAYYLRRLDPTSSSVTIEKVNSTLGTQSEFQPAASQLNPTKMTTTQASANAASGNKLSIYIRQEVILTADEVSELQNVINVLFDGDLAYGVVSEMAIVNAYPKTITSNLGGVTAQYDEAVAATIQCHIPCQFALQHTAGGINATFSIGDVLPYLR